MKKFLELGRKLALFSFKLKTSEEAGYVICNRQLTVYEDYLRCLFEKAPYAETENDWKKLLPWNIEITPYKIRGEWI
ncbi:MAG: transposase domain-containing protein [Treponema sp.]|nr:transposase domain-containing protein [Treponema sp.]